MPNTNAASYKSQMLKDLKNSKKKSGQKGKKGGGYSASNPYTGYDWKNEKVMGGEAEMEAMLGGSGWLWGGGGQQGQGNMSFPDDEGYMAGFTESTRDSFRNNEGKFIDPRYTGSGMSQLRPDGSRQLTPVKRGF